MQTAEIKTVSLLNLVPSNTGSQGERREHYDKAAIAGLTESIRTVGLLQPIVARPHPLQGDGVYEIVAGERRFLAATEAGLEEVPVSIRQLNDQEVLELQLIENLEREGLHELAEAEGYEALMRDYSYTAEMLVEKTGKSRGYVYGRLKLLALCKEARKAFYQGKITSSIALLIARIPVEALQLQAMKEILEGRGWGHDEPMSFRQAARYIGERYMLRLDQAGFKTSDVDLVPAAGACGPCPKRTGNAPDLFGDVKGENVCTDPNCFASKRAAHGALIVARAKQNGQKVITGKEAKAIAPYGLERGSVGGGYIKLDEKCYEDSKQRTYRQLVGKSGPTPVLLEDPEQKGKFVEVLPKKAVIEAARSSGTKLSDGRIAKAPSQKAAETRAELERVTRERILIEVRKKVPSRLTRLELQVIVMDAYHRAWSELQKRVVKLQAWELDEKALAKVKKSPHVRSSLICEMVDRKISEMSESQLGSFLLDIALSASFVVMNEERDAAGTLAAAYKIDTSAIRKTVAAEFAEKSSAKAGAKGKPVAKKKTDKKKG